MSLLSLPKTFIFKHVFLVVVVDPIKDSINLTLAINRKSVHEGVNAH
jgi:hypothetical protein